MRTYIFKLYTAKINKKLHNIIKILEYKVRKVGSVVQKIDRYYLSSQICHVCGTKNPETKNLTIR